MPSPTDVRLPRRSPESQGVGSAALLAFVDALEARCRFVHSVMVVRHGQVIAEGWWAPYRRLERHMLYSLSKSFTSTAAGLAIGEGRLTLDDFVLDFFPHERPTATSAYLEAMQVRHLLSMSTGHEEDTLPHFMRGSEDNWAKAFLAVPVTKTPGTHFLYNSGATYMVSAIVQKVTGEKVVDYLRPRLFEPLGIGQPPWEECPRGINTGGWGLNLRTEDIAKFGQLYLADGMWQGRRLLPTGWVREATRQHVANGTDPNSDWAQGYGFQFWRCRHDAFRGDGAFGQLCAVLPDQDCVVAMTSGLDDFQGLLNVIWETLLPALERAPKPTDHAAELRLTRRLDALRLTPVTGASQQPAAAMVDGSWYALEPNELGLRRLRLDPRQPAVLVEGLDGEVVLPFGWQGEWIESRGAEAFGVWEGMDDERERRAEGGEHAITGYMTGRGRPVSCTGAWQADGALRIAACLYRTPATLYLTLRFAGDEVTVERYLTGSFIGGEKPVLRGRVSPGVK